MLPKKVLLFLITILLVSSCSNIKSPEVKAIKNAKLVGLNTKTIDFNIDLELFNPNNEALQVKSLNLTALIEGIKLDAVNQKYDTKMLGKSTFLLPVNVGLSLKELAKKDDMDVMSKGLRIYNTGAIDLTLSGDLVVSDGVSERTVTVDHTQNFIFSKDMN